MDLKGCSRKIGVDRFRLFWVDTGSRYQQVHFRMSAFDFFAAADLIAESSFSAVGLTVADLHITLPRCKIELPRSSCKIAIRLAQASLKTCPKAGAASHRLHVTSVRAILAE